MFNASKPVTNPDLVSAIQRAREDSTPETWADMVRETTRARFITPVDFSSSPVSGETEKKTAPSFSLHMLEDPASRQQFYLAFTDWEELAKWRSAQGQRVLILTFDDYARLVLDGKIAAGGFIINPYSGNVVFGKAMIETVRREKAGLTNRGAEKMVMKKGTTVFLGEPDEYPEALIRSLSSFLETQGGVEAAYLQSMEKDGVSSYLVAVDFQGDQKALFDGISGVAAGLLSDMALNLTSCDTEFWRDTAEGLEPFYQKNRVGC